MQVSEEPLKKVTLNLNASDVDWLKKYYGWGYSEEVRRVIRTFVNQKKLSLRKGTIMDIDSDVAD